MGWDEAIFGWLYRRVRGALVRAPSGEALARAAHLTELSSTLALLASAVAERRVELRAADGHGGIAEGVIWLPSTIASAATREENEETYLLRALLSATAMREGYALPRSLGARATLAWTAIAMRAARGLIERELDGAGLRLRAAGARELAASAPRGPSLDTLVREALVGEGTPLERGEVSARAEQACAAFDGSAEAADLPILWPQLRAASAQAATSAERRGAMPTRSLAHGTERRGRDRESVKRVTMNEQRFDENPMTHSFEKVHTAEEYKGGRKSADGSDEMAAHAEALDELDLREVIRSNETTSSVYRADVWLDEASTDLSDRSTDAPAPFVYDEWNHVDRSWRRAWCSVRMGVADAASDVERATREARAVLHRRRRDVRALRAEFERRAAARAWRGRQPDGAEVDIDAVVDRFACLRAGHTPSDRLYVARRRCAHEVAAVILLDASLSTDGWVAGRRVLDVEREAVLVLGESLRGLHDDLAVITFSSHTRRDCRVSVVKGSREPWAQAWSRLAAIAPAGYTRMGPALRHATAMLQKSAARRRLLLLVSDGRPTDYDRYEGRYGVEDVAMAVREAESARVTVHALAVDAQARGHFTEMFGRGRFAVMARPEALVEAMGEAIARLGT
jgi:nitric oxide reductase NorD protein